jgi:integrase
MASVRYDDAKGVARIIWRFRGVQMSKTLKATQREAEKGAAAVEDAIQDVARGRLVIPDNVDVRDFLFSGGRVAQAAPGPAVPRTTTIGAMLDRYRAEPPADLETSTRKMVETHFRRVLELFPAETRLADFDPQGYIGRRSRVERAGRPIQRKTIEMELQTLRRAWEWAASRTPGLAPPSWTLKGLSFPKATPLRPFMTWGEVEREIARAKGRLTAAEVDELWDGLWLDRGQVRELLGFVAGAKTLPFLHPMIVTATFTGGRRSELCRSRVGDWDVEGRTGRLRQKKRDRDYEFTFRDVPMHPELAEVLGRWFADHPGGVATFAQPDGSELTWAEASHHFKNLLAGSKWAVVKGWHVLRHSFASNLAAEGVDQRLIDLWMGHSTEVRKRYQHIRPGDAQDAIGRL